MSGIGFNKKECRNFLSPKIKFNSGSSVLHLEEIKYIVCAAIKDISGERTLILYIYNRNNILLGCREPEYTLFQRYDDYITFQNTGEGKIKLRSSSLKNMEDRHCSITYHCAFYRKKDERTVTMFCNILNKTGFDAIRALQGSIMSARLSIKILVREQITLKRMEVIPAPPHGLEDWIYYDILPHYLFYDYVSGNKTTNGYCTSCRHDVLVNGAKYNGTGQCPNCGKKIIFKSNGKAGKIHDKTTVNVIQKVSDSELIIRTYKGSNYRCKKDISEFSICENARAFISKTGANAIEAESYYYSYFRGTLTHWIKGDRPVNRLFQNECSFESDLQGHLYCANLDETLKGTDWQYCQIERFYRMTGKPLDIRPYLIKYNKFPAIEYIIKMGLSDLAKTLIYEYGDTNVINKNGSNLRETLGIEPEELPMLQKINVSMNQLELYQGIKWLGHKVDEKLLLWYRKHKISLAENVLIPIRYISQGKLMRYAEEQLEHPRYNSVDMVSFDYKDYLNMAEKLGYDMKNSIVLFPKNLPDAHDTVSKMYDVNKSGIIKKLISDAYKNLEEKYSFTKDGLTLIPPKSAEEITNEGHILHHCVHSYVEKVTNGICLIFFIRRTENIKEPFYTLEVRNGRVIQVQGKYHCAPTKDVEKFLKSWERKKLRATYSA